MEREKLLIKFCDFLSHVMGPETEVVLHDRNGYIIWIAGGHITGREVGQQDLLPAMELVARQRDYEKQHPEEDLAVETPHGRKAACRREKKPWVPALLHCPVVRGL